MNIISALVFLFMTVSPVSFVLQESSFAEESDEPQTLEFQKSIQRDIAIGEWHTYAIQLEADKGAQIVLNQQSIDIILQVYNPKEEKIQEIDASVSKGVERITIHAREDGMFSLVVAPFPYQFQTEQSEGIYSIELIKQLTVDDIALLKAEQAQLIEELAEEAFPIRGVRPGSDKTDLLPLKDVLKEVRVVGLGEATHGTREFFQFKHRIFEFLVEEMDFNVFAIEASYAASESIINPYVQGAPGQIDSVLSSQGFWTWNTEEVRDLILWMRAYNEKVPEDKRVRFVGIDIQHNEEGRKAVMEYIRKVAPERIASIRKLFDVNVDSVAYVPFRSQDSLVVKSAMMQLNELKKGYNDLYTFLEENTSSFSAQTSAEEHGRVLGFARVLTQFVSSYSQGTVVGNLGSGLRDKYMAENFKRFFDSEPADTRAVVWAHNSHLQTDNVYYEQKGLTHIVLGQYLRQFYDSTYYALGLGMGSGDFQARDANPETDPPRQLRVFQAPPPREDTADWTFDQATGHLDSKIALFDFRSMNQDSPLGQWLSTLNGMFETGSMFNDAWPIYYTAHLLFREFDGVAFFRQTTRARPMPSVKNVADVEK